MSHSAGMSHGGGFASHNSAGSVGAYHSAYHSCFNCGHGYPHYTYPYYTNRYYVGFYGRYGYRYPYYGYGYYWPSWWDTSSYDNSDSGYGVDAARQIDDLSQQVQQLREQLDASQYESSRYGPPRPPSRGESAPQPTRQQAEKMPTQPDLATVLVFRDQRIQEVKNYAIVGKTLVVIADERQRKIPLADLDLDATTKLNEERGVDFQLPR